MAESASAKSSKPTDVASIDVEKIAAKTAQAEVSKAAQDLRSDFIVIFGLFASMLIFFSIEIQVLKQATRFSMLVGFSLFLLGAIQSFILGLYAITKDKHSIRYYKYHPMVYFIAVCFLAAAFCFFWATILYPPK